MKPDRHHIVSHPRQVPLPHLEIVRHLLFSGTTLIQIRRTPLIFNIPSPPICSFRSAVVVIRQPFVNSRDKITTSFIINYSYEMSRVKSSIFAKRTHI